MPKPVRKIPSVWAVISAVLLSSFIMRRASAQGECCIQVEINGPDACTTIPYCNANQDHCLGNCEGVWAVVGPGPTCIAQGASCSPTAPVQCCDPFSCVNAVNNVGVCGEAQPTPVPEPTHVPAPTTPVPTPVTVPTDSPLQMYYFGHSLIYHTFTDYPDVNNMAVPVWLHRFDGWMADGQFRTNNYPIPPQPQWGFNPDLSVFSNTFQATNYDAVVYTELNFVQYKGPTETYDYDDPFAATPVASVVRIIDFVNDPSVPIYVYECWNGADSIMPGYYPFLGENDIPTDADRDAYYASIDTSSAYHQWWLQLMDAVHLERPQANVQFVPVSSVLGAVLTSPYLSDVPFTALFEDNAPHGLPSTYFLAALITYISITGQAPPAGYVPDSGSDLLTEIVNNYDGLVALIFDMVETGTPPPVPPVVSPTGSPLAPVVGGTDPPTASPIGNEPCCIQFDITGSYDICTTVDWCNHAQANCEGDCQGDWVQLGDSPVSNPTAVPVTSTPSPTAPSAQDEPCCIQFGVTGSYDVCTTVDWCNQEQSNCEGDCEGQWVVLGTPPGPTPTTSPVAPPPLTTAFPTPSPTSPPTSSVTIAPSDGNPCCIQVAVTGSPDVCTTVDWCNLAQANCLGDCEGQWEVIGSSSGNTPPTSSPGTPSPTTTGGADPCCVQEDFAGLGCTTVAYCNENEVHCTGNCEGVWTVVGDVSAFWGE